MDRLLIDSVRCFSTPQSALLRPMTFLVGENSSGKTTFLSMLRVAWILCQGETQIDFNEDPFQLGSFDQIASYRGGRGGRARTFRIGAEVSSPRTTDRAEGALEGPISMESTFTQSGAQPRLETWSVARAGYRVELVFPVTEDRPKFNARTPSASFSVTPAFRQGRPLHRPFSAFQFFRIAMDRHARGRETAAFEGQMPPSTEYGVLEDLFYNFLDSTGQRPYAFAPIRTRPQRTYDPLKDEPRPEGSHVPMILAKTFSSQSKASEALRKSLNDFGKASGLFKSVEVRRLGRKQSDPFQLVVKIAGPVSNLVDVGYGVSQILPIVVDILRASRGTTFLLQQPEVHLHPKAQAELASFLGVLAKEQGKRFIIETHSDYLLDRLRMDIRDGGTLRPQDVSILYFSRKSSGVTIFELVLDQHGNIVDAPPDYREFFLREEERILGR